MWKTLAELLDACSPDARGTDIQEMKKCFIYAHYYCVSHKLSLSLSLLCVSWTTNKVSLGGAAHGCPSAA